MSVPDLREVLVYLEQGQPEEAIPLLERLTRERPAHVTVHLLLARAYEQVGHVQAARVLWQTARFLMPNSPVIHEGLRDIETAPPAGASLSEAATDQHEVSGRQKPERALGVPAPAEEHAPTAPHLPDAEPPEASAVPEEPEVEVPAERPADSGTVPDEPDAPAPEAWEEDEPAIPRKRDSDRPMTTDDLLASLQQQQQPSGLPDDDNDDLQRLIDELEAARIEPSPDLDEIPPPELDSDIEDMVSETLARIYVTQGQHREAAKVYAQLARQHPERADEFEQRAAELRQQAANEEE